METYPEMNNKIKDILRINSDNPVDLYAAQRIEDLESDLKAVTAQRDKAIEYVRGMCMSCKHIDNERGTGECKNCHLTDKWEYNGLEDKQ